MPTQKIQYFAAAISKHQPDEKHASWVWKTGDGTSLSDFLIKMGNDGWEIDCNITHDEYYYTLIFKRPKP